MKSDLEEEKLFQGFFAGYRKWSVMIISLFLASVFLIKGLINSTDFVELLKGSLIAFFSANAGEHIVGAIKGKIAK